MKQKLDLLRRWRSRCSLRLTALSKAISGSRTPAFFVFNLLIVVNILSAQASEVIDSYCIDPSSPGESMVTVQSLSEEQGHRKSIHIPFHGGNYSAVATGGSRVELRDPKEALLQVVIAKQTDFGQVDDMRYLGERLIWINGAERDYFASIISNELIPRIAAVQPVTDLTDESCSAWRRWAEGCKYSKSYFSNTLHSVLVSGYLPSWVGEGDPVSREHKDIKGKFLRDYINFNKRIEEVPSLNGVVGRGRGDRPIFYDGRETIPINLPIDRQNRWQFFYAKPSDRVFLGDFTATQAFLYELLPGPRLREIQILNVHSGWRILASFPPYKTVFGIGREGIEAEIDGHFVPVARTASNTYISGPMGIAINSKGLLQFNLTKQDGTSMPFMLGQSSVADCKMKPSAKSPVVIQFQN